MTQKGENEEKLETRPVQVSAVVTLLGCVSDANCRQIIIYSMTGTESFPLIEKTIAKHLQSQRLVWFGYFDPKPASEPPSFDTFA